VRRTLVALAAVALVVGVPRLVHAVSGSCTILGMTNINPNLGLDFPIPVASGLAMPVELDEATGAFVMSRDAWASRFGSHYCNLTQTEACAADGDCPVSEACATGASFDTVGEVHGFLVMDPGMVTGTIDAAGNVVLPSFAETLLTDYVKPLPVLMNAPTVSTGIRQQTLGGTAYPSVGTPLDFTTGVLTLAGTDRLVGAPGGIGDNASGFKMTCRLAPIPTPANLPKPPLVLGKLGGKVRVATRAAPQARPLADAGDTLSMRATLIPGPSAPAVDGSQDFFVRVTAAGKEVALVFVPAPGFTAKGKRLVASRDDACDTRSKRCKGDTSQSCTTPADCTSGKKSIQAFAPDATDPDLEKLSGTPMLGGSIVLKRARRAIRLSLRVPGLALAALTTTGTITVTVGPVDATRAIVVRATGGKRAF